MEIEMTFSILLTINLQFHSNLSSMYLPNVNVAIQLDEPKDKLKVNYDIIFEIWLEKRWIHIILTLDF